MKKIALFTLILIFCTAFAKAQEAELDTTHLYTAVPQVKDLPYAKDSNIWTYIDQENAKKYSGTWVGMWLGLRMPMLSTHLHCSPLKKTDPNFGVFENCDASIDFGSDKKAKTISYVGKWKGCQGTETYTFYKHSPHQVFAWLTQEETWLLELRRPKTKTSKRQNQRIPEGDVSAAYYFDFQLNNKDEVVFFSTTYASEGFSIKYTIKKGAKKTTILEIVSDCSQAIEE